MESTEEQVAANVTKLREEMQKTEYTCAFGYAVKNGSTDLEELVKCADERMYEDKVAFKKARNESSEQ